MLFLTGQSDKKFFALMEDSARNIVAVAESFKALTGQMHKCHEYASVMKELETQGDHITHDLIHLLNTLFVTPFDREEILGLATRLDDIVDGLEAVTARLSIYNLTEHDPIVSDFGRILLEQAQAILQGVQKLCRRELKAVGADTVRINELENQADQLLREGLRAIFQNPKDIVRLIQLKEVYETLEEATDRAEDVANVLESVVMRNA